MTLDIRLEHRIPHPIESVWGAISTSKGLAAWLMENDFAPHIGHRFRLIGEAVPGWRGDEDGTVEIHGDPPNLGLRLIQMADQHQQGPEEEARTPQDSCPHENSA